MEIKKIKETEKRLTFEQLTESLRTLPDGVILQLFFGKEDADDGKETV